MLIPFSPVFAPGAHNETHMINSTMWVASHSIGEGWKQMDVIYLYSVACRKNEGGKCLFLGNGKRWGSHSFWI